MMPQPLRRVEETGAEVASFAAGDRWARAVSGRILHVTRLPPDVRPLSATPPGGKERRFKATLTNGRCRVMTENNVLWLCWRVLDVTMRIWNSLDVVRRRKAG